MREKADELVEVDSFVVVTVKDAENVLYELACVTRGDRPLIEALKFLAVIRVVLHEVLIPVCVRAMADRDRKGNV